MELLIPAAIIFLGGLIKGINGFGYALVSTSLLAVFMPAQEAVALMIIPLIAGNLQLVLETDQKELGRCMKNFSGFITFLVLGATAGMLLISVIPSRPLKMSVGVIALLFVASRVRFAKRFFEKARNICFKTWEPIIGFFSGVVYGASNVGVIIAAYLESQDLGREEFIGTLAISILGVSLYRILLAQVTGMYEGPGRILLSMALAVPGALAVEIGGRISGRVSASLLERISVFMIAVIGLKLLLPF